MGKEILNQIQEAQRVPYRINPRKNSLRHILIKLKKLNTKKKIQRILKDKSEQGWDHCVYSRKQATRTLG